MNVLIVKTHKTDGRAWAAWKIKEEKAADLEYVVSVGRNTVQVYLVHDFVSGYFFGNSYTRVAFDLEECEGEDIIANLKSQGINLFEAGWVLKFANV